MSKCTGCLPVVIDTCRSWRAIAGLLSAVRRDCSEEGYLYRCVVLFFCYPTDKVLSLNTMRIHVTERATECQFLLRFSKIHLFPRYKCLKQ